MLPATGRSLLLCAIGALSFSTAALAADPGRVSDARSRYLEDRAFCLSGASSQDRATCLREAGAALQEAPRGGLTDGASIEQNKFARCGYHKNLEDRSYCERRMRGEGTTSGSAESGGILRELTVIVPAAEGPSGGK